MATEVEFESLRAENARLRARVATLEQSALPGAAAFLESVLAAAPAIIIRVDRDLRIRYVNRLLPGFRMEDVIGSPLLSFVDPAYVDQVRATVERVRDTGEPGRYHTIAEAGHGQAAHYEAYLARVDDPASPGEVCLAVVDVTEDHRRREALADSEHKLRFAVEATGIGLWDWKVGAGQIAWDGRMREIMGRDAPVDMPRYIDECVHPEDRARVRALGGRVFETGVAIPVTHRIVRPDGGVRWVVSTGRPLFEDGRVVRMVGGHLDITEQKALEEQLRQPQRLEAIGGLTAGIAHNFNNLLAVIGPALELLGPVVPPSHQELVGLASHAAKRAAELVRQLMQFAGQRPKLPYSPHDLGAIVQAAVSICRRTFEAHIELVVEVAPGLPAVDCEPGAIEQALLNLLLNARDAVLAARGPAPRVRVQVDVGTCDSRGAEGAFVRVRVSDNGTGMTDDVRARIFDPFFTTKTSSGGTGLGLSTSYATVREHGGVLTCESAPGAGTTFTLWLPLASRAPEVREDGAPGPAAGAGRLHVLLVDDDGLVRDVVARILSGQGHRLTTAGSGDEAVARLAAADDVSVVLLDRMMPGGAGEDFLDRIRARAPRARVLLFTGQAVDPALAARVDGVVVKPARAQALLDAIAGGP